MTTDDFDREEWVLRLSQALASLATVQDRHRDEIYQRHRNRPASASYAFRPIASDHPSSDDLHAFYSRACVQEGQNFEERYGPLRILRSAHRAGKAPRVGIARRSRR